jgi:hypothetical protein
LANAAPLVDSKLAEFFEDITPAKENRLTYLEIGQFPLSHPEIDCARRAPQPYRKFAFYQQTIACAVNRLLAAVSRFHAQILRVVACENTGG